jgi:hypothetical protein
VPVFYDDARKAKAKEAVALAIKKASLANESLKSRSIAISTVPEPLAAFYSSVVRSAPGYYADGDTALVVDFGASKLEVTIGVARPVSGTTVDAVLDVTAYSCLDMEPGALSVPVAGYLESELMKAGKSIDKKLMLEVREKAEKALISLALRQEATINFMEQGIRIPLSGAKLAQLLMPLTEECRKTIRGCMAMAGVQKGTSVKVILAGGASGLFRGLVREETGMEPYEPEGWDSVLCVAEGAAAAATILPESLIPPQAHIVKAPEGEQPAAAAPIAEESPASAPEARSDVPPVVQPEPVLAAAPTNIVPADADEKPISIPMAGPEPKDIKPEAKSPAPYDPRALPAFYVTAVRMTIFSRDTSELEKMWHLPRLFDDQTIFYFCTIQGDSEARKWYRIYDEKENTSDREFCKIKFTYDRENGLKAMAPGLREIEDIHAYFACLLDEGKYYELLGIKAGSKDIEAIKKCAKFMGKLCAFDKKLLKFIDIAKNAILQDLQEEPEDVQVPAVDASSVPAQQAPVWSAIDLPALPVEPVSSAAEVPVKPVEETGVKEPAPEVNILPSDNADMPVVMKVTSETVVFDKDSQVFNKTIDLRAQFDGQTSLYFYVRKGAAGPRKWYQLGDDAGKGLGQPMAQIMFTYGRENGLIVSAMGLEAIDDINAHMTYLFGYKKYRELLGLRSDSKDKAAIKGAADALRQLFSEDPHIMKLVDGAEYWLMKEVTLDFDPEDLPIAIKIFDMTPIFDKDSQSQEWSVDLDTIFDRQTALFFGINMGEGPSVSWYRIQVPQNNKKEDTKFVSLKIVYTSEKKLDISVSEGKVKQIYDIRGYLNSLYKNGHYAAMLGIADDCKAESLIKRACATQKSIFSDHKDLHGQFDNAEYFLLNPSEAPVPSKPYTESGDKTRDTRPDKKVTPPSKKTTVPAKKPPVTTKPQHPKKPVPLMQTLVKALAAGFIIFLVLIILSVACSICRNSDSSYSNVPTVWVSPTVVPASLAYSNNDTLMMSYYTPYPVTTWLKGDIVHLDYSGTGPVDVYIMNSDEKNDFSNDVPFSYYYIGTSTKINTLSIDFTVPETRTYYIVIYNPKAYSSKDVTYTLKWRYTNR